MRGCTKLNVRNFCYVFLGQEFIVFVDKKDNYKTGDYIHLHYENYCPDCEEKDKIEIVPLGLFKIIDTDKVMYKDLDSHSKISTENLDIIKNDLSLRFKDIKDNDELCLIICKNNNIG